MSGVKPTLVSYEAVEETVPPNSWLSNFPLGKWIDAQSRNWYWVLINAVSVSSAYEYKIRFDVPVENTTLIFPFVVKTSDKGVKKVFINGVEYKVRSKENYGNRFVVSGQEFSFKVATEYKLTKRIVPIMTIENKQAVFKIANSLTINNYYVFRQLSSEFRVINTIDTLPVRTLHFSLAFISSEFADCLYIVSRNVSGLFYNFNKVEANQLAIRNVSSFFNNINTIDARTVAVFSALSMFYNINTVETKITALHTTSSTFYNTNVIEGKSTIIRNTQSEFSNINMVEASLNFVRNTQPIFTNSNQIACDYVAITPTSSTFNNINLAEAHYIVARFITPAFANSNSMECRYTTVLPVLSEFININSFSVPVIANCRDTSWARFGGIWQSCDTWMPPT